MILKELKLLFVLQWQGASVFIDEPPLSRRCTDSARQKSASRERSHILRHLEIAQYVGQWLRSVFTSRRQPLSACSAAVPFFWTG